MERISLLWSEIRVWGEEEGSDILRTGGGRKILRKIDGHDDTLDSFLAPVGSLQSTLPFSFSLGVNGSTTPNSLTDMFRDFVDP